MTNFTIKTCLLIMLFFKHACFEIRESFKITTYEYGEHVDGAILSFVYTGVVPAFNPHYNLIVKPHIKGENETFTYLRVQYLNPVSQVTVDYNRNMSILNFYIKYPFISFPFGVDGYSLPQKNNDTIVKKQNNIVQWSLTK